MVYKINGNKLPLNAAKPLGFCKTFKWYSGGREAEGTKKAVNEQNCFKLTKTK